MGTFLGISILPITTSSFGCAQEKIRFSTIHIILHVDSPLLRIPQQDCEGGESLSRPKRHQRTQELDQLHNLHQCKTEVNLSCVCQAVQILIVKIL